MQLVAKRHYDFQQPSETRGGFGMTQIRLHRSNAKRSIRRTTLAHHGAERFHLDWITERRSGAMSFHIVDIHRLE